MTYGLIIKRKAKNILKKLSRTDRNRIAEEIKSLGKDPDDPSLDIRPLEGQPYYRLRV